MERIAGLQLHEMNEKQRKVADEIIRGPRGRLGELMALWLHSADLAEPVQEVGSYFRLQPQRRPARTDQSKPRTRRPGPAARDRAAKAGSRGSTRQTLAARAGCPEEQAALFSSSCLP